MPDTLTAPPAAAPSVDRPVSGAPSTGAKPSSFKPHNPASDRVGNAIQARANKAAGLPPPETPAKPAIPAKPDPAIKPPDETLSSPKPEPLEGVEDDPNKEVPDEAVDTKEGTEKTKDGKPAKVSPWKLVEQYKKTASELKTKAESLEAEVTKLRAAPASETATKETTDRAIAAEKRVKELEDELRFTRYEKHPEYQEKYAKPYDQAWKRATSELSEVTVTDPGTGAVRAATADDMLALVNLPLGKAREYAEQLFGHFADDAMDHRKTIKGLFESQQQAIKDARENGSKREQQQREQSQAQQAALHKELSETWESSNKEIISDPAEGKFLSPVEGDKEGNDVLAKGYALVDKAFASDPRNPSLTPEQRKEAVKLHSAMRNRAAAYGRLKLLVKRGETRIGELEKLLEEFNQSEPGTAGGNGKATTTKTGPSNPFDRIANAIKKRAH